MSNKTMFLYETKLTLKHRWNVYDALSLPIIVGFGLERDVPFGQQDALLDNIHVLDRELW